jgi:hypothetical protein
MTVLAIYLVFRNFFVVYIYIYIIFLLSVYLYICLFVVMCCPVRYRRSNVWADPAQNWQKYSLGQCDEDRAIASAQLCALCARSTTYPAKAAKRLDRSSPKLVHTLIWTMGNSYGSRRSRVRIDVCAPNWYKYSLGQWAKVMGVALMCARKRARSITHPA